MNKATASSYAAPTFFDPKELIDDYGFTEFLIDGGIICNNPALYAYEMSKYFHEHKKIRVMSLGTDEKPFQKIKDPSQVNKLSYLKLLNEFMMNADTYTADKFLKVTLK